MKQILNVINQGAFIIKKKTIIVILDLANVLAQVIVFIIKNNIFISISTNVKFKNIDE